MIDANIFNDLPPYLWFSLLWSWSTSSLTSSTLITVLGWQPISNRFFSESMMETTVIQNSSHPSRQKFFIFLCTRNLQIVASRVCALCFTSSLTTSWSANSVCTVGTVGFQLLSILSCHSKSTWNAHLTREFLQAECSTSRRTTSRLPQGRLPVPTLSDDKEDGASLVGGPTVNVQGQ